MDDNEIAIRLYIQILEQDNYVFGVPWDQDGKHRAATKKYLLERIQLRCPYALCIGSRVEL